MSDCNNDCIVINDIIPPQDVIIVNSAPYTFVISINGKSGVVTIDKLDVGLGNVDNTSDLDKPISNATLSALLLKTDLSLFLTLNDFITSNSGNWDSVYLITNALSSNWESAYSYISLATAINLTDTANVISFVQNNSSNIVNVDTLVMYSSSRWENAAIFVETGIIDCGFF